VGFGVVTAATRAQAEERSDPARSGKGGHKGVEAADAAVALARALRTFEGRP
jgi:6,7-dimethyl-8-ribityllumazine synthase